MFCINPPAGLAQSTSVIAIAPQTSRSSNGSRMLSHSPHNQLATGLASIRPMGLLPFVVPTDSATIIGDSVLPGTTWAQVFGV